MTRRISPFATEILFGAWNGRHVRTQPPAPEDRPVERRTRRSGWFTALRNRPPLV